MGGMLMTPALKRLRNSRKKIAQFRTKTGNASKKESPYIPVFVTKTPACQGECPSGTNIRGVLTTIANTERDGRTYHDSFRQAFEIIAANNPFPAVCGRVCPHPCESGCNRQYKDGSLAINNVERFIGDYALRNGFALPAEPAGRREEKIAVVGSGPAGLSAAYQLARRGYAVTVFEAFARPGGMLRYGIPDYRLPQDVLDSEIDRIRSLGVDIRCNVAVGRDILLDDLRREYAAVFLGIGAHAGRSLGLPGEDAANFFTVTHFLNRINSGCTVNVGNKVLVVGGGDAAIDAARICRRLGADVTMVYRRTRNEMPAIESEIVEAEEEGVKFRFLAAPVELLRAGDMITGMRCQSMRLGRPDASGRRRPEPVENDFTELAATAVIAAIGQVPCMQGFESVDSGRGWIRADSTGITVEDGVYSGGDALGLSLVTTSIYQGRIAAAAIDARLRGVRLPVEEKTVIANRFSIYYDHYAASSRNEPASLPLAERMADLQREVVATLDESRIVEECARCMSCGLCFDCGNCWNVCGENVMPLKGRLKGDSAGLATSDCKGCRHCMDACPCGFIEMIDPATGKYVRASMDNSYLV